MTDHKDESFFNTNIITYTAATKNTIRSFISGAGAGALSTVICCPLDVAKVRIQVQGKIGVLKYSTTNTISAVSTIAKEEGLRGLYKGLGPALLTVPLFWSMYWCTYNRVKEVLVEELPHTPVVLIHITAAITAGAIGDVITNPLWVTRTRIQTLIFHNDPALPSNHTTIGMIQSIYKNEGISAFYKGLGASFLGLSHVAVQFPLYEYLKKVARDRRGGDEESMVDLIGASMAAKVVASLLTYPHEVLRSRMQDIRIAKDRNLGLLPTIRQIMKEEGILSLWSGLQVNIVRIIPATLTTFLTYEYLSRYMEKIL